MESQPRSFFYQSLRFRFGLLFNSLLFLCVSVIVYSLYNNAKTELDRSFSLQLSSAANAVLQKTDINPISVPLPKNGEFFRIIYDNHVTKTQLINTLPRDVADREKWRMVSLKKYPENGGSISVDFALSAENYHSGIQKLRRLLYIYLPVAFLVSFLGGYLLSGFFLRPLRRIIRNANTVDLEHISLLSKSQTKDEFYHLTDALNRMLMRIDEQVKQQTAFFTTASHELRTPISTMLTELQIFDRELLDKDTQKLLDNQEQEVKRMKALVDNFLWMSQIESGNLRTNRSEIDIAEMVLELSESFMKQMALNGQRFRIEFSPVDGDFTVLADKSQVEVIIKNLISNAVKYLKGDPVIDIRVFQNQHKGIVISNSVSQTIENPEKLKGQFLRDTFHKDGFGLGLWISDILSGKNKAKLSLDSADERFSATIVFDEV
ncbi:MULTISPECIES: HAMP domain-containing sensor histidine kinase [Chryseobacterium]|uniref:histidine kinase n=1 Tax=Chryseobacterium camelliae TaxID=1265445 RepID=A0ABU0TDW0_9FLAO|nr:MULTISPECIES: HAMP domain-containing sensor histidine kinase [Chryseobacterium]MDT3406957.1 two-component system heavy metal sensor histidine kinase CusS [Pseudacidovorax intermedius]MDQ1095250.1 two-component system heavy metal sensor histidine kinase CusS [Chryseobacterium camelliae]MDQ1099188.1 two-component system heavy metal sensor histidine kinase CusS [Chryseobacterium sp. SORGH_AS_1048]MDR6086537.1 two-component system heavy metal sensor histidine kinase CusS [Chryseobacterium sp. SO